MADDFRPTCYLLAVELDVGDLSRGRAELQAVHGLVLDLARPQPRLQLEGERRDGPAIKVARW